MHQLLLDTIPKFTISVLEMTFWKLFVSAFILEF